MKAVLTVYFVNKGQDILEFDISDSQVVDSRPTGGKVWRNFQVMTPVKDITLGTLLQVRNRKQKDAAVMTIRYPVLKIEHQSAL